MLNFFQKYWNCFKETFKTLFSQKNFIKKYFFVFFVYLLALSSLIIADYFHTGDDYVRAWNSIRRWSGGGRHLNDYIGYLFNFSYYHRDITPLTNFLAIAFLSLATLNIVYVLKPKMPYLSLFVATSLGLSPYFLQNLSYKFDCAFFCLSVLFSTIPFLFYKKGYLFYFVSFVFLSLVCITYQASISIFGMFFLFLLCQDYLQENSKKIDLLKKAFFGGGIALIVVFGYAKIERLINDNLYTLNRSILCFSFENCWEISTKNGQKVLVEWMWKMWDKTPLGYVFFTFMVLFCLAFGYKAWKSKNGVRKIINLFLAELIFIAMFLCIFLWTIFFTEVVWSPRIYVGVGAFMALGLLTLIQIRAFPYKIIFRGFAIVMVWGLIVFSLRYGNLLKYQWEYDYYKLARVARILKRYPQKEIIFKRSPRAPSVLKRYREYPFFNKIVLLPPLYFTNFYFGPSYSKCQKYENLEKEVLVQNTEFVLTKYGERCIEINVVQ